MEIYGFSPLSFQDTESWKNSAFAACRGCKTYPIEEVGTDGSVRIRELPVGLVLKGVMAQYRSILWTQFVADPATTTVDRKSFDFWLFCRRAEAAQERAFRARQSKRAAKAAALDAEGLIDRSYKGRTYKVSVRGLSWKSVRAAQKAARKAAKNFGFTISENPFSALPSEGRSAFSAGETPAPPACALPNICWAARRASAKSASPADVESLPFLGLLPESPRLRNEGLLSLLRAKLADFKAARAPLVPIAKRVVKTPSEDSIWESVEKNAPIVGCVINGMVGIPKNPIIQRLLPERKYIARKCVRAFVPQVMCSSRHKHDFAQLRNPDKWIVFPSVIRISTVDAYATARRLGLINDCSSALERVKAFSSHHLDLEKEVSRLEREACAAPRKTIVARVFKFFFEEYALAYDEVVERLRAAKEDRRREHLAFLRNIKRQAHELELKERQSFLVAIEEARIKSLELKAKIEEGPPPQILYTPEWHVVQRAKAYADVTMSPSERDIAHLAYENKYVNARAYPNTDVAAKFRARCDAHFERIFGYAVHRGTRTETLTQVAESPPPIITAPVGQRVGGNPPTETPGAAAVRAAMRRAVERNRPGPGESSAMPAREPLLSHRGQYYARSLSDRYNNICSRNNAYDLMRETDVPIMEFTFGQQQDIAIPLSSRFGNHQSLHVGELEIAVQSSVLTGVDTAMAIMVSDASHDRLEEGFLSLTILRLGAGWMRHTIPIGITVFPTDPLVDRFLRLSVLTGGSPMADGRQVARLHYGLLGQAYTGAGEQRLTQYATRRINVRQTHVTQFLEGNHIHIARSEDRQQPLPHMSLEFRPLSGSTRYVARPGGYQAIESGRQSVDITQNFIRMPTHLTRSATDREETPAPNNPNEQNVGRSEINAEIPTNSAEEEERRRRTPHGSAIHRGYTEFSERNENLIEHLYVPSMHGLSLKEDIHLFTKNLEIPSTADFCKELARYSGLTEAMSYRGASYYSRLLSGVAILRPHFKFTFRLVTPILESIPLFVVWDDLGQLNTKVSLLSSAFQVIDSDHTRAAVYEVRPSGPTDLLTPSKANYGVGGDLVIFSGGYGSLSLSSPLRLKIEACLLKDTSLGSGEIALPQGPSSMLSFHYLNEVDLGDVNMHIFLGSCKYKSSSTVGGRKYISVCPAAGLVHKGGKAAYLGLGASLFSLYNFWKGSYVLKVDVLSKGSCAGAISIYIPPPGSSADHYSQSQLDTLPRYELPWRGSGSARFEVENFSWIGWHLTKPQRYITNEDWFSLNAGLLVVLNQPPTTRTGGSSDIRVIFRIVKFKNLTLKERSTTCDIFAGIKDSEYTDPLVDVLDENITAPSASSLTTVQDPDLGLETTSSAQTSGLTTTRSFGAYYAYLLGGESAGNRWHSYVLPITMGHHREMIGASKTGYLNTQLDETIRIRYSLRNPLHILCSAGAYYAVDLLFTLVVDGDHGAERAYTQLGLIQTPLMEYFDGYSASRNLSSEGGYSNQLGVGKSYVQLIVPRRNYRARSITTNTGALFFETIGSLTVKFAVSAKIKGVHLYVEPVGPIDVDGYGRGADISLTNENFVLMPSLRTAA
ncbi:polyprotein [Satsuma dwarf virus]|uniref:RNA2 polyprotein n=4 Tax=Satsuma dwarf virus TaxID=47416 RepID=POL2_SDVS5|nr:polyprotein [Satsuma dwarf virus]Q9WAL9.1 RecName: Full=RNA2 polyprotein; AltName: Full=P2; Contains: RecName: Full=Movement protein; Short=MP; Contains: RecName: Full=Large capsid protein; Short=LCP; Contains: RecName: Full=Small capsid protein; Short=SCP [Satsuma dwarf virus S-58]BAA76747.1 polyprotein [Satsuma dwarf virus]